MSDHNHPNTRPTMTADEARTHIQNGTLETDERINGAVEKLEQELVDSRHTLSRKQNILIADWIRQNEPYLIDIRATYTTAAKLASGELGFSVSPHHVGAYVRDLDLGWRGLPKSVNVDESATVYSRINGLCDSIARIDARIDELHNDLQGAFSRIIEVEKSLQTLAKDRECDAKSIKTLISSSHRSICTGPRFGLARFTEMFQRR